MYFRYYPRPNEVLLEAQSPKLDIPLVVEIMDEIIKARRFLIEHQYDLQMIYSDFLDENEEIPDPIALPLKILDDLEGVLTSMGRYYTLIEVYKNTEFSVCS
jgi:hypothetical protein